MKIQAKRKFGATIPVECKILKFDGFVKNQNPEDIKKVEVFELYVHSYFRIERNGPEERTPQPVTVDTGVM
jgi:hypothetical protein